MATSSIAAGAWKIDALKKTADLVDEGRNVFTSTTRAQVSLAAARILKKQLPSTKNKIVYVASFEVDMLAWLDAYKKNVGSEGWAVSSVDAETTLKQAQAHFAAGEFQEGYVDSALAVCTGKGYQNHFSAYATLANEELDLPEEDIVEVVKEGLSMPNPFA